MFNFDIRKVGGLTWVRIGRLTIAFNVGRRFRPLGMSDRRPAPVRYTRTQMQTAIRHAENRGRQDAARRLLASR